MTPNQTTLLPRPAADNGEEKLQPATLAPGRFEQQLTSALAVQRVLIGNDLLNGLSKIERGEEPGADEAGAIKIRKGRCDALLLALFFLWGEERFNRFCEVTGISPDELDPKFRAECAVYAEDAGNIWADSARLSDSL